MSNLTPSIVDCSSDDESIGPLSRQSDSSFSPTTEPFKPPPQPTTHKNYEVVIVSSDEDEDYKMQPATEKQATTTSDYSFSPESLGSFKLNSSNEKSPKNGVEPMETTTTNDPPVLRAGPMFQWGVGPPDDSAMKKRLPDIYIESESKKRNIMDDDYELPVPVVCEQPAVPIVIKFKGVVKMIAGINVEFPLNPYPSQVAVMNAVSKNIIINLFFI